MWNWLTWQVGAGIGGGLLLLAVLVVARRGGMATTVLGWLVVAVLVAGGVLTGLLWLLGWPALPPGAAFGPPQLLELLKIALAVVAGLGGVVLLAVNLRKQRVTEKEHDLAVRKGHREATRAFNERFGVAAEQLAHASPAVRLAGVYAMAGLADGWSAQRQVCVDVLCGYLRVAPDPDDAGEREVRAAVLKVIRERTGKHSRWSLLTFDFSDVVLENADFSGLTFRGRVVFDRADFTGAFTSFAGTRFSGTLSCHGTDFLAERTTFARSVFQGASAEFVGARFTGALDFYGSKLNSADLDFYRVDFSGVEADFSRLGLRDGMVHFNRCDFVTGVLDLSRANLAVAVDVFLFDRIEVTYCRFERSRVDIRGVSREHLFWFEWSRFDDVEFPADGDGGATGWLHLSNCELTGGTVIPEAWLEVTPRPDKRRPAG
ncbi:pentapeptide repeat-containing protein [Amycolatopsis sp. 195334CR]|uniref:pentapeptide repeat-containing protein n=1 Tax=Amycolatopsis sp. 195334CR TaxID=2814588 RepID=UPI001A8E8A7E|nr:pentapeptide repeat-containing protein [Amycolatopsis sp. 195334CR]MBN6035739.1 pentapeptide repeat-containing protein [Amycolatopsis sp. 195334CR]